MGCVWLSPGRMEDYPSGLSLVLFSSVPLVTSLGKGYAFNIKRIYTFVVRMNPITRYVYD